MLNNALVFIFALGQPHGSEPFAVQDCLKLFREFPGALDPSWEIE